MTTMNVTTANYSSLCDKNRLISQCKLIFMTSAVLHCIGTKNSNNFWNADQPRHTKAMSKLAYLRHLQILSSASLSASDSARTSARATLGPSPLSTSCSHIRTLTSTKRSSHTSPYSETSALTLLW